MSKNSHYKYAARQWVFAYLSTHPGTTKLKVLLEMGEYLHRNHIPEPARIHWYNVVWDAVKHMKKSA